MAKARWRELDARDNGAFRLLWKEGSDLFRVAVTGVHSASMPFEQAMDEFHHPSVSRELGALARAHILGADEAHASIAA